MARKRRTILINGGGIAGLTAALCLARAGFRVDLFERAAGFETIGAGLQISPNALEVLERIGIARSLKPVATGPAGIRVMNARSGRHVVTIPLGSAALRRYGRPYLVVHRADLQQILSRAAHEDPDIELHLGARIEEMAEHANGVTALAYGSGRMTEHRGVALIAADGVWSKLRERLFALPPAKFIGMTAWRGLIAAEQLPQSRDLDNMHLWLAPGAHAVSYPVRGGRYLNVVIVTSDSPSTDEQDQNWAARAKGDELREKLPGWAADFQQLLAYRANWTRWPLYESSIGKTASGAAALIGDAAHAMPPFAAQGAAMAIEDAAVLADCLAATAGASEEIASALQAYQAKRQARIEGVKRIATRNRLIYHLPQPLAGIRNGAMRLLGGPALLRRQDWIYSWRSDH